jgi:ketosteroid isomerase-like protein
MNFKASMRWSGAILVLGVQLAGMCVGRAGEDEEAEIKKTAIQFIETFNKNDMKSMEAMCTEDAVIIDDTPPYIWQGAGACSRFADAWQAARISMGVIRAHWETLEGWTIEVDGPRAYVAIPVRLELQFKAGRSRSSTSSSGRPVTNDAPIWTILLVRAGQHWRVSGHAWVQR